MTGADDGDALTAEQVLTAPTVSTAGDKVAPLSIDARQLDILARQLLAIQGQLDVAFAIIAGLQDREQERERIRAAAATLEEAPPDDGRRPPPTFGARRRAEAQQSTVQTPITPTGGEHGKQ